jgi:SPOR domain
MNQELRIRPAIDLDELDRQLRAGSKPAPRQPGGDPLHELAKIVGQDDPFRHMFSPDGKPEAAAPSRGHGTSPSLAPAVDPNGVAQRAADMSQRLDTRGLINRLEDEMKLDLRPALPAENAPPPLLPPHDAGDMYGAAPEHLAPVSPLGSRGPRAAKKRGIFAGRKMVVLGGVVSLGLVGVVGIFAMKGNGVTGARKEAPIIASKAGPSKERPANPGGAEVPSQGSDIFLKTSDTASVKDTKVVNTIEQPVDLSAAKKDAPRVILPGLSTGSTPQAAAPVAVEPPPATGTVVATAPAGTPATSEPRRVRGVSIRNGEPVESPPAAAPATASNASGQPASGSNTSATKTATPAASTPTPAPKPTTPAARPSVPKEQTAKEQTAKEQTTAAATPQPRPAKVVPLIRPPAAVPESTDGEQPIALTPSKVANPPRVASLPAAPAEANVAPAPAASAGNWAVQLASRPTEGDARTAAQQLGQRYSSALSGNSPRVVRGEANGNTVYRVRVSAGSKERAASLCEEIKSAGGSCWISAN